MLTSKPRACQLTMMPVVTAIPRPQYVLGTISPNPTLRNVMAISHIAFSRLACSSSWNLVAAEQPQHPTKVQRAFRVSASVRVVFSICHVTEQKKLASYVISFNRCSQFSSQPWCTLRFNSMFRSDRLYVEIPTENYERSGDVFSW